MLDVTVTGLPASGGILNILSIPRSLAPPVSLSLCRKRRGGVGLLFAIIDLYCLRETLEVIKKRPGTPLPNSQEAAMNYETNRGLPKKSTSETSGCRCSDCARCRCCRQSNSQVGRSSKRSPYMEPRWCRWCLSNDMFIYIYIYIAQAFAVYIYIYMCVCANID